MNTSAEHEPPPRPLYRFTCSELPAALAHLRSEKVWLTWDFVWNSDKRKWDKPPSSGTTGRLTKGSASASGFLATFEVALATMQRRGLAGIGIWLEGAGLSGADLDDCITDSGSLSDLAAECVCDAETYCEVSPSGEGLHFLIRGKAGVTIKRDDLGVEVYERGRYFTFSGNKLDDAPDVVAEAPRLIERLVRLDRETPRPRRERASPQLNGHANGYAAGNVRPSDSDFFANVNSLALQRLDSWVPALHPRAVRQATGAWRISSKVLGRDFEEDLSYHRDGINDFGEEHGITAIDAVMRYGMVSDAKEASRWLCQQMGVEPFALGWRGAAAAPRVLNDARVAADADVAAEDEWPDPTPLPAGLLPVAPFDFDILPDRVRGRVEDISERIQCPPEFAAVPLMIGLGTVIGRKVGVRPKRQDDWTVPANLWGCVVNRPGRIKTPVANEALAPIKALEAAARDAFKAAKREAKARKKAIEAEGGDPDEVEEPVQRRLITGNITGEALAELLKLNPNGLLNVRDELMALLRFLDDPTQSENRGLYLTGWSGTVDHNVDRIGRGLDNYIPAICISMFGTSQPSLISRFIAEVRQGGRGNDGLMQRFGLLVWPDPPSSWTYVDRHPSTTYRQMAAEVFKKLDAMTYEGVGARQDKLGTEAVGIPYLRFAPAAQERFISWFTDLERRLATDEWADEMLQEHISKHRGLVPALALISHLADWDGNCPAGPISLAAIEKALKWAAYLETHAARAYASGDVAVVEAARAIIAKVKSGHLLKDGFRSHDVWRPQWSKLRHRPTVTSALEMLVNYDWLAARRVETNGRAATLYIANPKVLA